MRRNGVRAWGGSRTLDSAGVPLLLSGYCEGAHRVCERDSACVAVGIVHSHAWGHAMRGAWNDA